MKKNLIWGIPGVIILWYLIRILSTWFGFKIYHPIAPILELITGFAWATKYILPWIVLYWLIRFIQAYERKKT
ncbi:hypothetical protein [Pontibacillus marinus]|uniref:Uncharacterized protein n=1 Tax=Pontibacillus marinus BH030004 = DSM 16465 TaxID=1385511 RepID=A0A0A5HJ83_9BACI|nr:hypothetical protein [Pontibacillus marinus]KGX83712.1 hypothetical protein N783_21940 [Pontibacillus marinus BH030004 = DSM 16465]